MLSTNQIEIIREQAYCCVPSNFNDICEVYPFTPYEIIKMGRDKYNRKLGMLLLTETDICQIIKEKTGEDVPIETIHPLEYLLQSASLNDTFLLDLQDAFSTFIKEDILLLPKINSVLIGANPMERRLITEDTFRDFQDILRIQNLKEIAEPPPKDETPGQRKMRLLREKVAAVKKKQAQKKGEGQTFAELMEIADTFGIDKKEYSLYAYYKLIRRHQMREKWQQDLQMLCAGADSNKLKTKYWGESPDD